MTMVHDNGQMKDGMFRSIRVHLADLSPHENILTAA